MAGVAAVPGLAGGGANETSSQVRSQSTSQRLLRDLFAVEAASLDALAQGDWQAAAWVLSLLDYGRPILPVAVSIEDTPLRSSRNALDGAADGDLRALIASKAWPFAEAWVVMMCESGGDPAAISPDGQNWGLMQVNLVHLWRVGGDPYRLLDPETNVRVAWDIYVDGGGWGPWACKPEGGHP